MSVLGWATLQCTDQDEILHGGADRSLPIKFHLDRFRGVHGFTAPKLEKNDFFYNIIVPKGDPLRDSYNKIYKFYGVLSSQ